MENMSCVGLKRLYVLCCLFLVAAHSTVVNGISKIEMSDNCGAEISMIFRSVYQTKLTLNVWGSFTPSGYDPDFNSSVCDTHIQAWYNKPNLMFYIDKLDVSCDEGYLQFFDGYTSSDVHMKPYLGLQNVCGPNFPKGVYTTKSRDLRVKYVARQRVTKFNVLSLIITAYDTDRTCAGYEYGCKNGRCIDDDAACNGYNSCGDNSSCRLSVGAIIGISIGASAGFIGIVSVVVCVACVRRDSKRRLGAVQNPGFQQAGLNTVPYQQSQVYGTQPQMQTQYGVPATNFGQPQTGNIYPTQSNNMYA